MFNNGTQGPLTARLAGWGAGLSAIAAAAALSFACPASAATYEITSLNLYGVDTSDLDASSHYILSAIDNGVTIRQAYSAPAVAGLSPSGSFLAFCIDMFTDAPDFVLPGAVPYESADWTDAHKTQVENLVKVGTALYDGHLTTTYTGSLVNDLASIQGAIWEVMNPTLDFATNDLGTLGDPIAAGIDYYKTQALGGLLPPVNYKVTTIFSDGPPQLQALALSSAVPEPDVWALMIFGCFSVGLVLRSRARTLRLGAAASR